MSAQFTPAGHTAANTTARNPVDRQHWRTFDCVDEIGVEVLGQERIGHFAQKVLEAACHHGNVLIHQRGLLVLLEHML